FWYHARSGGWACFPLLRLLPLQVHRRSLLPLPALHPSGYTRPVRFRWPSFFGGWGSWNQIVMGFVTRLGVALPSVSLTARGGLTNLDTLICASLAHQHTAQVTVGDLQVGQITQDLIVDGVQVAGVIAFSSLCRLVYQILHLHT